LTKARGQPKPLYSSMLIITPLDGLRIGRRKHIGILEKTDNYAFSKNKDPKRAFRRGRQNKGLLHEKTKGKDRQ